MAPMASAMPVMAAPLPNWDTTGSYVINMNYIDTDYAHDMTLVQDDMGMLTGNGGSPAGGPHTYTWVISSGTVAGDTIDFLANYTASADAVTPQTVLHVMGTIAEDGSMSGTWSDNYQAGAREGTWTTASGMGAEYPDMVKVTIIKYVDEATATAESAGSMDFPMTATWAAENIGAGTAAYTLSETGFNNPNAYYATTADMTKGADYTTSETTDGEVVGASCETEQPYMLTGYTWGNTLEEAGGATPTVAPPAFTSLLTDKFVIVWNTTCDGEGSNGDGEIGGDVEQGNGVLNVDSIEVVDSSATANNTYESGWKYIFHITTPNDEENLAMKFSDWLSGANTIPVASNMRISSMQANNGGATITLTAANTYSTPALVMVTDLDAGTAGRQVQVIVEVKIPAGTSSGSYTTTYGVQTTP